MLKGIGENILVMNEKVRNRREVETMHKKFWNRKIQYLKFKNQTSLIDTDKKTGGCHRRGRLERGNR